MINKLRFREYENFSITVNFSLSSHRTLINRLTDKGRGDVKPISSIFYPLVLFSSSDEGTGLTHRKKTAFTHILE